MIKATLKINDIDLSNIIAYEVTPTAVVNNSVITLDGKIHRDVVGWKDYLNIQLGDTSQGVLKLLFDAITETPSVTYYCERTGANRTTTFILDTFSPLSMRIWTDRLKYFGSAGIVLIEEGVYQL
jgi:hypothetical protein